MNKSDIEVKLIPSLELLSSAAETGSTLLLQYTAEQPCRLMTLYLRSDDWLLREVTLCRRLMVYGPHVWGGQLVMTPGQTLEVVAENKCWSPGMADFDVLLRFEYFADVLQSKPVPPTPNARKQTKPVPPAPNARNDFMAKLAKMAADQQEELQRRVTAPPPAPIPPVPEPAPPPPPQPTRFSELDIEDDE